MLFVYQQANFSFHLWTHQHSTLWQTQLGLDFAEWVNWGRPQSLEMTLCLPHQLSCLSAPETNVTQGLLVFIRWAVEQVHKRDREKWRQVSWETGFFTYRVSQFQNASVVGEGLAVVCVVHQTARQEHGPKVVTVQHVHCQSGSGCPPVPWIWSTVLGGGVGGTGIFTVHINILWFIPSSRSGNKIFECTAWLTTDQLLKT